MNASLALMTAISLHATNKTDPGYISENFDITQIKEDEEGGGKNEILSYQIVPKTSNLKEPLICKVVSVKPKEGKLFHLEPYEEQVKRF